MVYICANSIFVKFSTIIEPMIIYKSKNGTVDYLLAKLTFFGKIIQNYLKPEKNL
jgi:hypothetical protein